MGTLTNPRHERFVQALFEGETADAAYAKAGYKPNDGNCIRLKGNERVQAVWRSYRNRRQRNQK
jgi:hypothetical protein